MITHRCACQKSYTSIIITSITWAGTRCVQEAAAILGPQNRTQGRCEYCLKCESTGKTLSTGPSPSRRFICSSSDSTVRGVRMVDPRQCSEARAVIMEHYRILVSPASCRGRGRDTAAVGTGVSWRGNYSHAACSILVKILIKQNGHHSAIYSFL